MWLTTYSTENDPNAPRYTQTISAATYTQAYIKSMRDEIIILEIKKI